LFPLCLCVITPFSVSWRGLRLVAGSKFHLPVWFSVRTIQTKRSPQLAGTQSQRLKDYIRTNLDCALSVKDLANLVHLGPRQFFRRFVNTFGTTPHRYVVNERVTRAKQLLLSEQLLSAIAVTVGFANQSHLSVAFRKVTGMSPNQFRQDSFSRGQHC
jgi:AraC-like DNA-binding protein